MGKNSDGWVSLPGLVFLSAVLGWVGPRGVSAQPLPQSPEFQVNTFTDLSQAVPAIAADSQGRFVVVWSQYDMDSMPDDITARLFDSSGNGLADDFQVNVFTTGQQRSAAVGRSGAGDFVIVWGSEGQDGDSIAVAGRRYDSTGNPLATEFVVNSHTPSGQTFPKVAMGTAGNFVVVWQSYLQDGSSWGIFGQRFDSSGGRLGAEFAVNAYVTSDQQVPNVFLEADNSFIVTWNSNGQDGGGVGAFGRRFDSNGAPVGGDFQISAHTLNAQSIPTLAYDADGGFVAAWQSQLQDGSGFGVFGRRFDSGASPLGTEFQINTYVTDDQFQPVVLPSGSGAFVVVWYGDLQDGDSYGVFARAFTKDGVARGEEIPVNTTTENTQRFPRAVATGQRFVVVWQSALQDGSLFGIFGRRFLFAQTLDVDGDGQVQALTDALLILRYAFGFRGSVLTSGAVGPNCTRCDSTSIVAYLDGI
jgi:hypothetical protein